MLHSTQPNEEGSMKRSIVARVCPTIAVLMLLVCRAASPTTLTAQRAAAPPSNNPLKEFGDAYVGRWIAEIIWATDYPGVGKKGEKVTGYEVIRWTADGKALEAEA